MSIIGADYPIATSLLTEFTPTRKRGLMVGMSAVAWSAGAVGAYLIDALVIGLSGGNDHWHRLLFSSAILGVIVVVLRRGIPESPRWLLKNGRAADTEAVVDEIYGTKLDLSAVRVDAPDVPRIDVRIFLRGQYLRRLIMCSVLYLAVVTPLYALLTFLPVILTGFAISGNGRTGLIVETVVIGLVVAGSIPAVFLVEKWGRRPLSVLPLGLMVLPLTGPWPWADGPLWFVVVAFCAYAFISAGPSVLVWICPNELFPTEVRATAAGIATAVSRFGAATWTSPLRLSISAFGTGVTMLFRAGLTAVTFVVCLFMASETRNKSLEESASLNVVPAPAQQVGEPR